MRRGLFVATNIESVACVEVLDTDREYDKPLSRYSQATIKAKGLAVKIVEAPLRGKHGTNVGDVLVEPTGTNVLLPWDEYTKLAAPILAEMKENAEQAQRNQETREALIREAAKHDLVFNEYEDDEGYVCSAETLQKIIKRFDKGKKK